MAYTWSFSKKFAQEFSRYPDDQQEKILDFVTLFESQGLINFSSYEGKIARTANCLDPSDPVHVFATKHSLWHYHIGLPTYVSYHGKYKTSDWVLHFKWPNMKNSIVLVDVYCHYDTSGKFYIPPDSYMD
ncbi:hypothetical protein JD974_12310 [Chromobacterium haemolyticum]|uniref:Uncharacterized protein n=1 Tax=Chromobacterium haemolyticum TaxID=394935 RepID=A0ABS3GNG0_9NEIS|nr:hypothetical protein [Chromobacterium haemolyticum]MBK0415188.1 hypothetical protein [Chromobacterium haemolyticum]MBO0416597.1 hypothetical protein [Chromobacterium haemolyticum]MBO0499827.1 hypothetical protein [Chromobacterium haemolyticum]QOD84867.1 hypothetical protein IEZ30_10470 [Chromobacterium haemolyticum]